MPNPSGDLPMPSNDDEIREIQERVQFMWRRDEAAAWAAGLIDRVVGRQKVVVVTNLEDVD